MIISWTSPALPHLLSTESTFPVTEMQGSWVASLLSFGIIIGYILNPFLIDTIGSKRTLLFLAVPQIISCLLIYFGQNWIVLCVARIIGGIGYGGGLCSTAIYVSQIGDENNRGFFLTFVKMFFNIGVFVTMIFGAFLQYNIMNLAILGIPLFFVITFFFMPNTDQFCEKGEYVQEKLTDNDNNEGQIDAFKIHNCFGENLKDSNIAKNLNDIQNSAENSKSIKNITNGDKNKEIPHHVLLNANDILKISINNENNENTNPNSKNKIKSKSQKNNWYKLFVQKNNRRALIIIVSASLTEILSGHMAIVSFAQQIFEYSSGFLRAEYAALILSGLKIGASFFSTLVVEKFERRHIFLITGLLASLSQASVGVFFFFKLYMNMDVSSITWLPLVGVSAYEVVGSIGMSSLYYVYQGELFANEIKGQGVTCTNITYEIITFLVKLNFQLIIDAVGIYSVFWAFSCCCAIGSCVTYWITPETKGKSRREIQKLLGDKSENF